MRELSQALLSRAPDIQTCTCTCGRLSADMRGSPDLHELTRMQVPPGATCVDRAAHLLACTHPSTRVCIHVFSEYVYVSDRAFLAGKDESFVLLSSRFSTHLAFFRSPCWQRHSSFCIFHIFFSRITRMHTHVKRYIHR